MRHLRRGGNGVCLHGVAPQALKGSTPHALWLAAGSYVSGMGFGASRFLDRSQLQTVGDPYDSADHPDDETRRSKEDRDDKPVGLGKARVGEGKHKAALTYAPAGDRYRQSSNQKHGRHEEQNLRETDR
jgi:hypothetical protein